MTALHSDLLARSLLLEFKVWHLNDFHNLPEDCRLQFQLAQVTSARATRWVPWPGEFTTTSVDEYHAKWREESESWSAFEQRISNENPPDLTVMDAELAIAGNSVALFLNIELEQEGFRNLTVGAGSLSIHRSDGILLSLAQFQQLGEDYWSAFVNRPIPSP